MKNIKLKTWEWLMIVVTGLIILFSDKIIERINEGSVVVNDIQGRAGKGWFRRLVQSILSEVPFGDIINNVWDEFWPK